MPILTYPPLARSFFLDTPDVVARRLLGKLIVRPEAGELLAGRIVETEAYFGSDDAAAHAFAGRTARTQVLFGPPGHAYVYFVYGMHHCLNVSCEPEGQAGCVLIRALEPVAGLAAMARLRGLPEHAPPERLASGPGRLCQALGITRLAHNGVDVTDPASLLLFAEDGYQPAGIAVSPRVGIRKAADRLARFYLEGNRCVSRR
ncbi:MAG TPA: DNA-3-methyladenine glycosylase [Acidobacteriaceae bacterium]